MDKTTIENRINGIVDYRGSINLCAALTNAMREMKLGSDPSWMVARSCMTPAEYIAFGKDGSPWNFMRGKPDTAQRAIESARGVVQKVAKELGLWCDWKALGHQATARIIESRQRQDEGRETPF